MGELSKKSKKIPAAPNDNGSAVSNGTNGISPEEIKHISEELYKRNLELANLYKERERLNKELESANLKLKDLDKLKTEFLSLASHQLRSPITAIKGYSSMLLEGSYGELAEKQHEAVSRVFQSSFNLGNVVEDLLDISKIEQGGMTFNMQNIDLDNICSDLYQELLLTAKSKGLNFTYENSGAEGLMVKGDPIKLRQVVQNLVDNSMKYTKEGFVKMTLSKGDMSAVITVTDSGMGMSDETKKNLFGKFARGEGKDVNAGGSGLGLYLVKKIVEAHNGVISTDSAGVGKGSTFTVTLPLTQ